MAKLAFLLDGKLLGEFALNKERITIGRRPSNDIHIDNLAVSGLHATILTLGNDSFLEDMNSTNGTVVNQKLIKKHVLQHSDVIEFGKYQLKFINEASIKKTNNDGFANTVLINSANQKAAIPVENDVVPVNTTQESTPSEPVAAKEVTPATAMPSAEAGAHLQVLNGENSGRQLLLNKALVKIGKPGEQLAVITKRPQAYFITHVEGAYYPLVNGQSIGVQAHALNHRDVIELAGIKMEFYSK
ncbi:MAG: FHA domain-containing protein [Methylophilaceae bacterium]